MGMVNEQNFNKLTETWRMVTETVRMVTVGQLALSETTVKNVFNLSNVKGLIITSKEVTLYLF